MNVYKVGGDLACGMFTEVRDDNDRAGWDPRYDAVGQAGCRRQLAPSPP